MNVPLTPAQIPPKSILDVNGKQTYLGNTFIMAAQTTSTTSVETPLVVIENPLTSKKSLFIYYINVMSQGGSDFFIFYLNPTLSSGTASPALNLRTGSTLTSVSNCHKNVTVSANGTYFSAFGSVPQIANNFLNFVFDPGSSFLISIMRPQAFSETVYTEVSWYEI